MIVLLTDFGQSEYVGVMKGVIYRLDTRAQIVDLCHDVSPQGIIEASWILKNSYPYFPRDSVFCCVVDPGVGSERKALAVKTEAYCFIAPDNGLLWETLGEQTVVGIRQLLIPQEASRTFHGRDVFARAAAEANLGRFDMLGEPISQVEKLQLYRHGREGIVVRVDRFGNIVTNLPPLDKDGYRVRVGDWKCVLNFYATYDRAPENELFLITGSNDTLEISLKGAHAGARLNLKAGQRVTLS
jgi:S-adenosylmethionine hydrolase